MSKEAFEEYARNELTYDEIRNLEYDRNQAQIQVAREYRHARQHRWTVAGYLLGGLMVLVLLSVGIHYWYTYASGPEPVDPDLKREQTCLEKNGVWMPGELIQGSEKGLCVFPGDEF
jgi:hypothetical protein